MHVGDHEADHTQLDANLREVLDVPVADGHEIGAIPEALRLKVLEEVPR
jgi:hypothetical protein